MQKVFVFYEEAVENKLGKIAFLGDPEGIVENGEKTLLTLLIKNTKMY